MSYSLIPLQAAPAQMLSVNLGGQRCKIAITSRRTGLFLDLYVNDVPIILGVPCYNNTLIVRDAYLGFSGDIVFWDSQGESDPDYTGLGERFVLLYVA